MGSGACAGPEAGERQGGFVNPVRLPREELAAGLSRAGGDRTSSAPPPFLLPSVSRRPFHRASRGGGGRRRDSILAPSALDVCFVAAQRPDFGEGRTQPVAARQRRFAFPRRRGDTVRDDRRQAMARSSASSAHSDVEQIGAITLYPLRAGRAGHIVKLDDRARLVATAGVPHRPRG